ncbi:hypothetical protein OSB04_021720, partial [Centaurea solstitialis]
MKFFFPELGFCFGGTIVSPDTETISADASTTRRRVTQTKHWRPELEAIAEDSHEPTTPSVVRSEKKPLNKPKSTGKTRSQSYSGDYRKLTHSMAIPAFSPTPF